MSQEVPFLKVGDELTPCFLYIYNIYKTLAVKSLYTPITNLSIMSKVTIKVEADTHKGLIKLLSERQIEKGKRVTIDELIKEMIESANNL